MDEDPGIPDAFYWAFEERMRGSSDAVRRRLETYAEAIGGLQRDVAEGDGPARWIDLGCGRGEFCELLRAWGWEVLGVERSPAAVEATRGRGFEVWEGDVFAFLAERPEPATGVSAIQLIEHVPRTRWLELFEGVAGLLRPGGAFLLETINATNVQALADHFFADPTHTWPGHPETLRLLAEHAGFVDVEVRFEHPDRRGAAEDVAVWARTTSS